MIIKREVDVHFGKFYEGGSGTVPGNFNVVATPSTSTAASDIQARLPAALVSGRMSSDMVAISGSTGSADKLELSVGLMVEGTVSHDNTAASTTVFYCSDITEATEDHYKNRIVGFTSGDVENQVTEISAYALVSGEGKFTVSPALKEAPADNVTFLII